MKSQKHLNKPTIDHIAIRVPDIEVAQKWYEENCGAKLSYKDEFYRRMSFNNTTIALIDQNRYPCNHIGILVENEADLPPSGQRVNHRDGTIGVYVKDPFGNVIEFIYYSEELKNA